MLREKANTSENLRALLYLSQFFAPTQYAGSKGAAAGAIFPWETNKPDIVIERGKGIVDVVKVVEVHRIQQLFAAFHAGKVAFIFFVALPAELCRERLDELQKGAELVRIEIAGAILPVHEVLRVHGDAIHAAQHQEPLPLPRSVIAVPKGHSGNAAVRPTMMSKES